MRRLFELIAVLFAVALTTTGAEAKRVALVIGNDKYQHLEALEKAAADARTYAEILKGQGFDEVMLKTDMTRAETDEAFAGFLDLIEPGDTAVFAYSGHGWSDGAQNYLVAVDAPAGGRQEFLARISIPLRNGANGILDDIDRRGAGLKVAIIDACRDNPFAAPAGTRAIGLSRGLTRIEPPSGTFVIFSAGTNQEALDRLSAGDPDPNSVFTRVFAPLLKSGLPLQEATKAAQEQVVALARSVKHEQRPAYYDEVLGKACLAGACTAPSVADKPATPVDDTAAAYQAALAINTLQAWDAFLKYHPDGFYADLAQAARKKLGFEAIAKLNLSSAKPPAEEGTKPAKLPPLDTLLSPASPSAIDACDLRSAVMLDPDKPATLVGRGIRKPDEAAVAACRTAADAHPDVRRYRTQLAFALLAVKRFDEARKLLEDAAAAGHAAAMRGIGMGYFYGAYPKDPAEGVRWFEKAAAAGDPVGYWYLASAYYFGNGVAEDKAKAGQLIRQALPILERAAGAGDPDAPSVLAVIYFGSLGLPPDLTKAAAYLAEGFDRQSPYAAQVFTINAGKLAEKDRTRVEQLLADAGFSPGMIDGIVDDKTTAALQNWATASPPAVKAVSVETAAAAAGEASAGEAHAETARFYELPDSKGKASSTSNGTVVWRLQKGGDGPAIEARAEFPDRGLAVTVSVHRDSDEQAAMSHFLEIHITPAEIGDKVEEVAVVMRDKDGGASEPLEGASSRVTGGVFLFGLLGAEKEVARNLAILRKRQALAFNLRGSDGSYGVVTLEKGETGQRVVEEALAAWAAVAKK